MIEPVNWQDHIVEHPDWYKEVDVGNGNVQHIKVPGTVKQQGTPLSAKNLNHQESEALEALFMTRFLSDLLRKQADTVNGLAGEQITVTLTNTQSYPFNDSKKTVSLGTVRNTKNYTVLVEILSKTGAGVGDIEITDKLTNGFKIAYTGAASSVTVNCIVQGGI